jgi:hypothetical protein
MDLGGTGSMHEGDGKYSYIILVEKHEVSDHLGVIKVDNDIILSRVRGFMTNNNGLIG